MLDLQYVLIMVGSFAQSPTRRTEASRHDIWTKEEKKNIISAKNLIVLLPNDNHYKKETVKNQ